MENELGQYSVFRSAVNNSSNLTPIPFPDFNETVHFGGDPKTYRELVHTSRVKKTLNHTIEVLTNDSKTSRLAQRNKNARTKVIPRPQNAWIIYRRDKSASSEFKRVKSWIASKIIGERWRNESSEVIEYFVALSMVALDNHKKKYEDYKYQPRKVKTPKNHQRQPDDKNIPMNQDLPKLNVVPPSPNNNYLPTPVSSIQHSPVSLQDDLEPIDEILYPPTPASLNQYSPETFQDSFLEMNNLLTPASSSENTPVAFQDSFLELLSSNEISFQYSLLEQQNLLATSNQPDSLSGMYPDLSAITPTTCNNSPDNFFVFLPNADFFAAQPPSETITTNMDYQDFDLYPENEELITPLTVESTNIQDLVRPNNLFEYVPFSINNATLFSDPLGYYNDLPSSE